MNLNAYDHHRRFEIRVAAVMRVGVLAALTLLVVGWFLAQSDQGGTSAQALHHLGLLVLLGLPLARQLSVLVVALRRGERILAGLIGVTVVVIVSAVLVGMA